jgi:hypothetical protein
MYQPCDTATDLLDGDVVSKVNHVLCNSEHFRGKMLRLSFSESRGVLTIRGQITSYYLKQLLQTELLRVAGVHRIVNHTQVSASLGAKRPHHHP